MDFYNFIIGSIWLMISIIAFIMAQSMPDVKDDEFLSKPRVYVAATVILLIALIYLYKSFQ